MADELADFDPKETKVVVTAPEFAGLPAKIAKRRPLPVAAGATGLEYLVFSDDVRVAVVNHQWAAKPSEWPEIDLGQYISTINPGSPLPKKVENPMPYVRGTVMGQLAQFSMQEGSEGMACVAYDIKAGAHRLTGFMCVPGTAVLSYTEASKMIHGIGIKDDLPPG